MNSIITSIINSFESKTKTENSRYKEFITHVYKTFEDKINYSKQKKIKNKYKKIRLSILEYIIINEKKIKKEICKHN